MYMIKVKKEGPLSNFKVLKIQVGRKFSTPCNFTYRYYLNSVNCILLTLNYRFKAATTKPFKTIQNQRMKSTQNLGVQPTIYIVFIIIY